MKTRIFSTKWSLPVKLLIVLLIGLGACTKVEEPTPLPSLLIDPQPNAVEQYIGEYQQMFVPESLAKRITISNLVTINDEPGFTGSSFTHQVHVFGLMGDTEEMIAASWDGHQFTIDGEQVSFQGQPMTVNGRLYLFSDELSVNYDMITDRKPAGYAEKYRKL